MKKTLPVIILIILIVAVVSFYGGMIYGRSKSNLSPEGFQARIQQFEGDSTGNRGMRPSGSGFATGEIISKDDNSITLKLQDGGSKIIFFSDKTEISKFTSGGLSDLEIGSSIVINGTANDDGSITAQSIQLRPVNILETE